MAACQQDDYTNTDTISKHGASRLETLAKLSMMPDSPSQEPTGLALDVLLQSQKQTKSKYGNVVENGTVKPKTGTNRFANDKMYGSMKLAMANDGSQSTSPANNTCTKIDVRRPWSTASKPQRKAYLDAINCTFYKPGKFSYKDYKSRNILEDYALTHNYLNPYIHRGAPFLPCHRQFLNLWIKSMRNGCGYSGPIFYADFYTYADRNEVFESTDLWSIDNFNTLECPVSPSGFNGKHRFRFRGGVNMSADDIEDYPHNVCRRLTLNNAKGQSLESYLQSATLQEIQAYEVTFDGYRNRMEHWYHDALHGSIGGDMARSTSPYDAAIFFSHHATVDCLWWQWQERNNGKNRNRYSGTHKMSQKPVTRNDLCPMLGVGGGVDLPVMDLLHADQAPNCFTCQGLPDFVQ